MQRNRVVLAVTLVVTGIVLIGGELLREVNAISSLQPGMVALHLPSGTTAYLRRQAYFDKPADLYLSASGLICKTYDLWHDYKIADPIHGAPDSPLLISYLGNTIIVHAPKKPRAPWLSGPASFKVIFQEITPAQYAAYTAPTQNGDALPSGWERIEVPFEHNTCAL